MALKEFSRFDQHPSMDVITKAGYTKTALVKIALREFIRTIESAPPTVSMPFLSAVKTYRQNLARSRKLKSEEIRTYHTLNFLAQLQRVANQPQ